MSTNRTQQQAIRNTVYGLDLVKAFKFYESETDDLHRAEDIWQAIVRYWPNEAKLYKFVVDIVQDIHDIENKQWLKTAIGSHCTSYMRRNRLHSTNAHKVISHLCKWG